MSYKIQYPMQQHDIRKSGMSIRVLLLTALCFVVFCKMIDLHWQEGAEVLHSGINRLKCLATELNSAANVFLSDDSLAETLSEVFSIFLA